MFSQASNVETWFCPFHAKALIGWTSLFEALIKNVRGNRENFIASHFPLPQYFLESLTCALPD